MSVRLDEIDLSSHDAFVDEVPLCLLYTSDAADE